MSSTLTVLLPSILLLALLPISRACNAMQPCSSFVLLYLFVIITFTVFRWQRTSILVMTALLALFAQWGFMQFVVQHDFNFHYLGESPLSPQTPAVAKFSIGSEKFIRAYGPFAHANIFGGTMLIGLLITIIYTPTSWRRYLVPIFVLAIAVSFSRSAYLGLLLIPCIVSLKRLRPLLLISCAIAILVAPLILFRTFDSEGASLTERTRGYTWSLGIIEHQPIAYGVGIGNYVPTLRTYLSTNQISVEPWEYAPVHSVPLLAVAELGIIPVAGLLIALFIGLPYRSLALLLPLAPALMFDHYFATDLSAFALLSILITIGLFHKHTDQVTT